MARGGATPRFVPGGAATLAQAQAQALRAALDAQRPAAAAPCRSARGPAGCRSETHILGHVVAHGLCPVVYVCEARARSAPNLLRRA